MQIMGTAGSSNAYNIKHKSLVVDLKHWNSQHFPGSENEQHVDKINLKMLDQPCTGRIPDRARMIVHWLASWVYSPKPHYPTKAPQTNTFYLKDSSNFLGTKQPMLNYSYCMTSPTLNIRNQP